MTTNDVARQLGMILSPAQGLYREYRRRGVSKDRARQLAIEGAPSRASMQTQTVLQFIRTNAIWIIPDLDTLGKGG